MCIVGEGAAVHIVDDRTGALIAALTAAVDSRHVLVAALVQGVNGVQEALGAPSVLIGVDVLVCAHFLDLGHVDGHAVCRHAQGVLVVVALVVVAGGVDGLVDVLLGIIGPQVVQRGHDALRAPVGHQTLGAFHDEVGCAAALDGGVDLIVAVGIVQILDGHLDVRILCVEAGDQLLHGLVLAPAADGVCPQLDACAGGCGGSSGRSCSAGGSGLTAAGSQSTGCAQSANGLQEGATRDNILHNEFSLPIISAALHPRPLLLALL